MKLGFSESTSVEFKREYVSDINKTIIAFANTHGGTIYIGISDDGRVVGVPDADKTCVKVTNTIRSSIRGHLDSTPLGFKPHIQPLVGYSDGRKRLRVGKYRVIFICTDNQDLYVLDIGSRGDIYK